MIWTSVSAGTDRFHAALSWLDAGVPVVVFTESLDGKTWVGQPGQPVPTVFRSIRNAVSGSMQVAVGKGQDDGKCWLVNGNGLTRAIGPTGGEQCVGIEGLGGGSFRVAFVTDYGLWVTWVIDGNLNGQQVDAQPIPHGWIDGWTDYKNGVPLWIPEHRHFTDGTYSLAINLVVGNYRIGQSLVKDGCDALGPLGWQRVCSSDTPIPPYGATLGSRIVVAMSADHPQFVRSDDFGPMPTAPAVVIPTFPTCGHRMSIGFAFEPHPVDWCEWCVIDADPWQPFIDRARQRNVPIVADWDEEGQVFDFNVFAKFEAQCAGLRVIPALRFYPLVGETTAQSVARWEPAAKRMAAERPANWSYVFCIYTQNGRLPLQQVVDGVRAADGLALKYGARHAEGFAYNRADGMTGHAELMETGQRFVASVPSHRHYPTSDELVPVDPPTPEPPDPPVPPKPEHVSFEVFLMAASSTAMRLLRSSLFIPSKNAPGRFLYPAPGGGYLSLAQNNATGELVESVTHNDGGAEQFLWEKGRGLATIGDSTNPFGYGYPVMNDGEPKS